MQALPVAAVLTLGMAMGLPPVPAAPAVGAGLAAAYPADVGLAADPRVLLFEDFETGAITDLGRRWDDVSNKDGKVLSWVDDAPPGSGGRRALQMAATLGENTGGHLYRRLPRGVDEYHARFYVRFAPDGGYIHHFVHLGGYQPATAYPQGGAGERPAGHERITVGIEPHGIYGRFPAPGAWNFYAYWPEMKISADARYWGNAIRPSRPPPVPRDVWQCVEVRVKLNASPDRADGALGLWLDGQPVMAVERGTGRGAWTGMGFEVPPEGGTPFEGFRFRKDPALQLNFFWLLHYVTELAPRQNNVKDPPRVTRVSFDHLVVATEYVGPIKAPARP